MSFAIPRPKHTKVRGTRSRTFRERERRIISDPGGSSSPEAATPLATTRRMILRSSAKTNKMAVGIDRQPLWLRKEFSIEEDPTAATESSDLQEETAEECLPLLTGNHGLVEVNEYGLPKLGRKKHAKFLRSALGRLPSPFVMLDASRPWMFYWCTMGLHLTGEDAGNLVQRYAREARQALMTENGAIGIERQTGFQ